jgi:hypothetical protein
MSQDREYIIVRIAMLVALPNGDFHQEAEDIQDQWFEALSQEPVQSDDNRAKTV